MSASTGRMALIAVAIGASVGYFAGDVLPLLVASFRDELGLSATAAGVFATVMLLATAAAGVSIARVAVGALPRIRVARAGVLVAVGGYIVGAFADGLPQLLVAAVAIGVGNGTVIATSTGAVADLANRERSSSVLVLTSGLVSATLLFVLPLVSGGSHRIMMLVLAGAAIASLPLLGRLPPQEPPIVERGPDRRSLGLVLAGAALLFTATNNSVWSIAATAGMDRVGLSMALVGALLGGAQLMGMIGAGLPAVLTPKLGRTGPVVVVGLLDIACKVVIVLSESPALFVAAQLLWGVTFVGLFAWFVALGAGLGAGGRWAAAVTAAFAFGNALGPLPAGVLLDLGGYPLLASVLVPVGLVAVAGLAVVASALDRTR